MEVTAGFLVVKTFERMYREYLDKFEKWWKLEYPSSVPVLLEQMPGKYRGIARDSLQPWHESFRDTGVTEPTEQELAASFFMYELSESGKADDDFIFNLSDAKRLLDKIPKPTEREIIWARRMDKTNPPPPETVVLGYEPSEFYPCDHNSIICRNAFFRYWRTDHQGDPHKIILETFHTRLNKWGLFDTLSSAEQYLDFFQEVVSSVKRINGIDYRVEGVDYIAEIRVVAETHSD
jgi:hypothetical protein